jgi:hypothetical protein
MSAILAAIAAVALAIFGFRQARSFVFRRLTYVDRIHSAYVPAVAGLGAGLLALPIAAVLPVVGPGTAVLFGISVALGVSSGARSIRRRLAAG